MNIGERMYTYIQAFLTNRTAEIHFGPHTSRPYTLSGIGTPRDLSSHLFSSMSLSFPLPANYKTSLTFGTHSMLMISLYGLPMAVMET